MESKCEQHPSEDFRFFCEDCEILICDDCITGAHKNHKNIKMKEYGARMRDDLTALPTKAESTKLPEIEAAVEKAIQGKDAFNIAVQEGIEKVRNKRSEIDSIFDKLETGLIDSYKESETDAMQMFDSFIRRQKDKADKIKIIIDEVKSKGPNITNDETAIYIMSFVKLLVKDPFKDCVPSPPKLKYIFNAEFSKEDKMQDIIGYVESEDYSTLEEMNASIPPVIPRRLYSQVCPEYELPDVPSRPKTEVVPQPDGYGYLTPQNSSDSYDDLNSAIKTISKFKTDDAISCIVPKLVDRQAWVLGKDIIDVDIGDNIKKPIQKKIQTLTSDVVTACLAKNGKLLIGIKSVPNLWKLDIGSTSCKLVRGFKVCSGRENLACMCRSEVSVTEHVACVESATKYVLRRFSNGKSLNQDKVLTDIENPVLLAESSALNVCILCTPEDKSSWIVVLDKSGKIKMRFPTEDSTVGTKDKFVGAGFMKEGSIVLIEQTTPSLKLINLNGNCVVDFSLDKTPVCSGVDKLYNIWVGFEDNEVRVFKCDTENVYEVV